MTNPDPAKITDEMWKLWTDRPNKAWRLGGIYANKKGYHNTVIANKLKWPGNYSIQLTLDLVEKNKGKARAIDLTMVESEMIKWTKRMRNSALDPDDDRLAAVKEFYGTLDGKTVYGLSKDSTTGKWRQSSADITHLWHGHMSVFTAFVASWSMLSPILSVWKGESWLKWKKGDMLFPKLNDSGEDVKYWQFVHNKVKNTVKPPSPSVAADGNYGPATATAFADFWKKSGGSGVFNGNVMTGWLAVQYHEALAHEEAVKVSDSIPTPAPFDPEEIKRMVSEWLDTNVPNGLKVIRSLGDS